MIIDQLRDVYDARHEEVEAWLGLQRKRAAPFITTSVDLRHSGARLAPVDTNLYPAGFQNLSTNAERRAAIQFKECLGDAKRVLIVPENHTRNLPYFENLVTLLRILQAAGFEVEIGSLVAEKAAPLHFKTASGVELIQQPLTIRSSPNRGEVRRGAGLLNIFGSSKKAPSPSLPLMGRELMTDTGFVPEVILLNNDCSSGPPALLEAIAQPILPPVKMGWYRRLKSKHFTAYCALADEFAQAFGLDKWTICADFKAVNGVNFKASEGVETLAREVDAMIENVRKKHAQYGITDDPYVYVKADSGTYGMGIMVVRGGGELLDMNKKERNKMHVIKEGVEVHNVILQEGIPTRDTVAGNPAEPMIYLVDGVPVGGMYRVNANRDAYGNLNAAGMEFKGMCDEVEATFNCREPMKDCDFRVYGLIAALAALAAGRE